MRCKTNWLWTPLAIQCHILGFGGILIFAFALFSGERVRPANELKWALFALFVGYPVVLLLLRFVYRTELAAQMQDMGKPPNQLLHERQRNRSIMHTFLYLVAIACYAAGVRGWQINGFSATYLGVFLFVFAFLGHCGVNIWYGGPLDPRHDPSKDQT